MSTESESTTFALVAPLSRIEDRRQRSYALATRLNELDLDVVVDVIKVILARARSGHADSLRLYNGLLIRTSFVTVFGPRKMSSLVEIAQERDEFEIMSVLIDVPAEAGDERPHQPFLDGSLKEIPLGMRKSLARTPDFRLIQRIAKDQDPRVIEHLLNNPRLTEKDVIKIGSTRPTSPKVLEVIYNHPRWICRYAVKKTIVYNPYSPLSLSLGLLTFLTAQDLELLCSMPELDPLLLQEAGKLLGTKSGCGPTEYWLD